MAPLLDFNQLAGLKSPDDRSSSNSLVENIKNDHYNHLDKILTAKSKKPHLILKLHFPKSSDKSDSVNLVNPATEAEAETMEGNGQDGL